MVLLTLDLLIYVGENNPYTLVKIIYEPTRFQ